MNFIEIILSLIDEKGITKNKMLKDLKLGKNSIVDWTENGNIPNGETVIKIADYFNVSTDYLLGKTDNPAPPNSEIPILDKEAWQLMEEMHKRPELKVLFSTAKNVSKEDIEFVELMLQKFSKSEDGE